jgi:hypothetical protein
MYMRLRRCRGTVETFSSRDSDVLSLTKLVFHDGFEALKTETEKRYYAYRKEKLMPAKPEPRSQAVVSSDAQKLYEKTDAPSEKMDVPSKSVAGHVHLCGGGEAPLPSWADIRCTMPRGTLRASASPMVRGRGRGRA